MFQLGELLVFLLVSTATAWTTLPRIPAATRFASTAPLEAQTTATLSSQDNTGKRSEGQLQSGAFVSRRCILQSWSIAPVLGVGGLVASAPSSAMAEVSASPPDITDRVYLTVKGLPSSPDDMEPKKIVIGLFGNEAPASTVQLKKLLTNQGLVTPCKPRAERALQKEQLEANSVYNGCKETENDGINLKYSTIWRVLKDERVDVGAVSGRFIAREYPEWKEAQASSLKNDVFGTVSVRRGNDGGFGFTIYTGENGKNAQQLDEDHIVVGRVIEGMDVVRTLNEVPVVTSSKVSYMGLAGGPKASTAPDRSCRYGGPMYCNENKPLTKLIISDTGVLS